MIQANELRIGNLFMDSDKTPCYFAGAWQRTDGWIFRDSAGNTYKEQEMFPIPLTPAILEKCGFIPETGRHGYEYWYPNENALWSIRQEGNGVWQFCVVESDQSLMKFDPVITSLHWLQNVYYFLTGGDLTINL